ncbi:DNA-binding protein [Streptomyces sp. NPDC050560]|uniref:DNA-binding protein n=1 Tax=Streptomyces sp. NPDC050560 TaxID=3365630 RepID=UPI0037AF4B45
MRAVAFHLRRHVGLFTDTGERLGIEELADRTRAATRAEAVGDDVALARVLPELIAEADRLVTAVVREGDREAAAHLRVQGHVVGAGLLRRLGYKDLAWVLLHRARPGSGEVLPVLVEEVRLLIDLGLPEYALARAERAEAAGAGHELQTLVAFAHATAGRRRAADRVLDEVVGQAAHARELAEAAAARAAVAAEYGDADEAADHVRATDLAVLNAAQRSRVLVIAATAEARRGRFEQAAARVIEADAEAPFRVRLDPFARELLAALVRRTTEQGAAVRHLAEVAGLP